MAAKKEDLEGLLARFLGRDAAKAMMAKVDLMVKQGKTAAEIERTITLDVTTEVEKGVVSTVIAKIGPMTPIKVQPIRAAVKQAVRPIAITPRIKPGVGAKVGMAAKVGIGKRR